MTELIIISAFMMGFVGSVHCVGMCGPLAISMPFSLFSAVNKWVAIILYNLGRVIAYSIIGIFVGILGRGVNWFGLTQILSLTLGALVVISVVSPTILKVIGIRLPQWINKNQVNALQFLIKKKSVGWMFLVGVFNGFLPCGLVYMALAAALSANTILGSITFMAFFGLGTIPTMITVIIAGQYLSLTWRMGLRKLVPIVTFIVGTLLILRGLNLNIPYVSPYLHQNLTGVNSVDCVAP